MLVLSEHSGSWFAWMIFTLDSLPNANILFIQAWVNSYKETLVSLYEWIELVDRLETENLPTPHGI